MAAVALVVERAQPFRVREASEGVLRILGYDRGQVVGRSVRFLHGPATVGLGVIGILKTLGAGDKPKPAPRTLAAVHGSDGGRLLMSVEGGLDDDGESFVLRMEPAQVTTAKMALADDGTCKMVLSADTRRIEAVSAEFEAAYGFSVEAALGRTANLVQGPGSDPQRLKHMMDVAAGGMPQWGKLLTFGSDCTEVPATVTVTGVYDSDVGRVSHFLVSFVTECRPMPPSPSVFRRTSSASFRRTSSGTSCSSKSRCSALRLPSVVTPASLSERCDVFLKATLFFLALPTFLFLGGPPMASGSVHACGVGVGARSYHGVNRASRAFESRQLQSYAPLRKSFSALTCNFHNRADSIDKVPEDMSAADDRMTLVLDLDKTVLYGNDGNDLGVALQWMDKDHSTVEDLYSKLINPNLRATYDKYVESGQKVDVVIYTRRPQIVYYKSCVRQNTVPVRYADDWHAQGQLVFPSRIKTSEEIFSTYAGPDLLEDEQHDVKKSLDRLLAARDAVARELGLAQAPRVVVTSQAKNLAATARHLGVPIETCLLFDDNTDLRRDPRVVLVEPLESLPRRRRQELLAFMQLNLPVDTLDQELVEYLEDARPDEKSIRRDADGTLSWWVPEATHPLPSWRTPDPGHLPCPVHKSFPVRTVSHETLPLKGGAKHLELRTSTEPFSNVSPADVPVRTPGQGLVDLRAAAEKAALMRGLACEAEEREQLR